MSYKKIIPFINTENEVTANVLSQAVKYVDSGADELFVFRYATSDIEREEFLGLLKTLVNTVDVPIIAGIYMKRFEDAKKAF